MGDHFAKATSGRPAPSSSTATYESSLSLYAAPTASTVLFCAPFCVRQNALLAVFLCCCARPSLVLVSSILVWRPVYLLVGGVQIQEQSSLFSCEFPSLLIACEFVQFQISITFILRTTLNQDMPISHWKRWWRCEHALVMHWERGCY